MDSELKAKPIKNLEKDGQELYNFDEMSKVSKSQSEMYSNESEQIENGTNHSPKSPKSPNYFEYQMIRMQVSYDDNSQGRYDCEHSSFHRDNELSSEYSNGSEKGNNQDLSIENLTRRRMLPLKYHNNANPTNHSNFRPPWNSSAQVYAPRVLKHQILNDKEDLIHPESKVLESRPILVRNLAATTNTKSPSRIAEIAKEKESDKSQNSRPYWKYAYRVPKDSPKLLIENIHGSKVSKMHCQRMHSNEFGDNYKASPRSRLPNPPNADCSGDKTVQKMTHDAGPELKELKTFNAKLVEESKELRWKIVQTNNENRDTKEKFAKLLSTSEELESANKFLKDEVLQVNHKVTKALKAEALLKTKILLLEKMQKDTIEQGKVNENELVQLRMENNSLRKLNDRLRQEIMLNSRMAEYMELESMFKNVMERRKFTEKNDFVETKKKESANHIQESKPKIDEKLSADSEPIPQIADADKKSEPTETEVSVTKPNNSGNSTDAEGIENLSSSESIVESIPTSKSVTSFSSDATPQDEYASAIGDSKNIKDRLLDRLFKRQKPLFIIGFGDTFDD